MITAQMYNMYYMLSLCNFGDIMTELNKQRMVMWIDKGLHMAIKTHSYSRGMNMKSWVIEAIVEKMEREGKLEEYSAGAKQ